MVLVLAQIKVLNECDYHLELCNFYVQEMFVKMLILSIGASRYFF